MSVPEGFQVACTCYACNYGVFRYGLQVLMYTYHSDVEFSEMTTAYTAANSRSSEIQGTALGKSLRAWTCIYRSMPAGVTQSRHASVGGTVSTWGR